MKLTNFLIMEIERENPEKKEDIKKFIFNFQMGSSFKDCMSALNEAAVVISKMSDEAERLEKEQKEKEKEKDTGDIKKD